jgi:peptidoglycan/LPS O-acetylase OafA/YrhL
LRAVAALSVLVYHAIRAITHQVSVFGLDFTFAWYYTQTGVHLFFVLSGFLLFMPYARALVLGRPLPSARQFYRRRALRILPAYYVCLTILVLLALPTFLSATGLANIAAHLLLVHDDFADLGRNVFLASPATMSAALLADNVPDFNRTIEGPFWTLAVEAQFYLLLPWMAWGIARLVGAAHSVGRTIAGVLAVIAAALLLRELDSAIFAHLQAVGAAPSPLLAFFLRVTLGWQGKFLEVFAVGMLCAVLYVAASEGLLSPAIATRRTAIGLLALSAALWFVLGHVALQYHIEVPPYFNLMDPTDLKQIAGPFAVGVGYGALLLAVLWGGALLRSIFAWAPLRFVGLISYSLYLWHQPIVVNLLAPHVLALPAMIQVGVSLVAGLAVAVPVAYLSYQLVERPFLERRRRTPESAAMRAAPASMPTPTNPLAAPADPLPLSGASASTHE